MKRIINFRIAPLILLSVIFAICTITFCSNILIILAVLVALTILLCAIFIKKFKKARAKLVTCILVFFIFLGLTSLAYDGIQSKEIYCKNSVIEGEIDMTTPCDEKGEITYQSDKNIYVNIYLENVTVDGRKIKGKAKATFIRSALVDTYAIGDRIKFKGDIAPLNFVVTDNYSMSNYRKGIYHNILCNATPQDDDFFLIKISEGAGLGDRIKLRIKSIIYSNTRSDTAGFLFAMTFGDKSGLDENIKSGFSYTGTAHVFAVSGLHVGMLAGALLWLLRKTKLTNRITKIAILSTFLLIFCALCDFSPSTVRASIMTLTAALAKSIGLRNDGLSSMSMSAIAILLFKPLYLFEMGFLMSFIAVVGILMLGKPISKVLKRLPKKLNALLSTSLAVNFALLPIMMYYFQGETLLFIIANLLLLPILGICFPIYFIVVFIAAILPFMGWSITLTAAPFTVLIKLIEGISKLPTFVVSFSSGAAIIIFGIVATVALSQYVFADKKLKRIVASVMCIALVLTTSSTLRLWGSGNAYVHCFTDDYGCQYLLVDNAFGGNYLIINDEVGIDAENAVVQEMVKHKFAKLDGIVIVGDVDVGEVDRLKLVTACPYVYAFESSQVADGAVIMGDHIVESGLVISYLSRGCLDITLGERTVRVLARDYYAIDEEYDVLVTYSPTAGSTDGKYIVCEYGYTNSLENYVSGAFTFKINNDRIKVDSFWRY